MQNNTMPTGEVLRQVTCLVAENMFGQAFDAVTAVPGELRPERLVTLQLEGSPQFTLTLGWQEKHLTGLHQIFRGEGTACAADASLLLDALGEVLNIVAGQLKTEMALDHALGLPKLAADVPAAVGTPAYAAWGGWVQQRGGEVALFIGAFPDAALDLPGKQDGQRSER